MSSPRLLYGVAADGTLRYVSTVPGGAACGLRCPACETPLLARQGRSVRDYLAHAERSPCVEADTADLGGRGAAVTLLAAHRRLRLPELAALAGKETVEILQPAQQIRFDLAEATRGTRVGEARVDLRLRRGGREMATFFRTRRPVPTPDAQAVAAAGGALLEIWIPADADPPDLLQAAAETGFRTWRAHRLAGARIAPDLPPEPPFDRLGRADRARAVRLLALPAPPDAPAPVAHPLIGRPLLHDGLISEPSAVWQTRILAALASADGALDHCELVCILHPPSDAHARCGPGLRQALGAARLHYPWCVLDEWLRQAVRGGLLAQAPCGGYLLSNGLSAHTHLTLAAARQIR
jgi:hypothetical protein